jgi:hypothetical protein
MLPLKASASIRYAAEQAAPNNISLIAPRTVSGGRPKGRSRIRSALPTRAADSASPTRRWPSSALASSTARISCSFSCRNAFG